jgi:hypothetical protein
VRRTWCTHPLFLGSPASAAPRSSTRGDHRLPERERHPFRQTPSGRMDMVATSAATLAATSPHGPSPSASSASQPTGEKPPQDPDLDTFSVRPLQVLKT